VDAAEGERPVGDRGPAPANEVEHLTKRSVGRLWTKSLTLLPSQISSLSKLVQSCNSLRLLSRSTSFTS
jgi:hypothetical protein